ncbi:hypothetical protein ABPG72_005068 [Tetrahymena utriculariae]
MSNSSFQFYGVQQIPFANSTFPNNNNISILLTFNYFTQNNQVINLRNDTLSNFTIQCYNIKLASSINLKLIFQKLIIQNLQNQGSINHIVEGALYLENLDDSCVIDFDKKSLVTKNKVLIGGGGGLRYVIIDSAFSVNVPLGFLFETNIYQYFAEIFGDDSTSYLQDMIVENYNTCVSYNFQFFGSQEMVSQNHKSSYSKSADINQFQSSANLLILGFI